MSVRTDPEGNETRVLFELVDLDGREVLEIGCGDGRLTWRYADRATRVTAIDAFDGGIQRANRALPDRLRGAVEFRHAAFEDFAAKEARDAFDVAILAWSLC